jgi:YidC/Oxa1 family membrane protein insertase
MILYTLFIQPLESLMAWLYASFYNLTGNYGLSIILLSLTVNTILLPLYAIADRLKDNEKKEKEKMADELENISSYSGAEKYYYVREIYRRHGYHPLKSLRIALGFLIQVPFFIAVYQFLGHYENFVGVGFLFIKDLSRPDALLKGINILPFVMTGINLISAFVFTRGIDKSEKLQLYGLSALFLGLLYNSPAGLVFYWTMNNVFSLGKSWFLNRKTRESLHDEAWFLTREKIRELFTSPISDRIAFVSFAPAIYAASMSYPLFNSGNRRVVTLSLFALGMLFLFNIFRFILLSKTITKKNIILLCVTALTILLCILICDGFFSLGVIVDSRETAILFSIIVQIIGITMLQFALFKKLSLLRNSPVLLTILVLNLLSIIYVTALDIYVFIMFLIVTLSAQLCCGYDFLPHETKPLLKVMVGILLLVLSVFILIPFKFVLTNPEDYQIPIKDFVPYLVIYPLLLTSSFFIIFWFLIKTKVIVAYIGLFCIVIYFIYSSIPYDIGQIKDFMLENPEKLNFALSLRSLEILVISFLLFFGYFFMVKKKGIIYFSRSIIAIAVILSSLFSIQVGRLFINNYEKIKDGEIQKEYKGGDRLILSSNGKNIIVLFLDGFSSQILPDLFGRKPELMQELDGFVWYKDTITAGSWTWNGLPGIWGGHDYTPDKVIDDNGIIVSDYFYGAYNVMPKEMLNRGFKVHYYNQHLYTALIETVLDKNFKSFRIGSRNKNLDLLHRETYLTFLNRVTLFIGSPFFMKSTIYSDGTWRSILLTSGDSSFIEQRTAWEGLIALKEYSSEPLGDVFTFFMSLSSHGPYFLNWNRELTTQPHPRYWDYDGGLIASYYTLKSVVELIDKLKSDGLYEKTKIILVSDHGNPGVPKTQTRDLRNIIPSLPRDYGKWFDSLLMVKEFDSSGPLTTDTRFMSNADVLCFVIGKGDQIPAGRRLIYTAQYTDKQEKIMIQMDTSLSTDGWKIIRNDVTTASRDSRTIATPPGND